MRRALFAAVLLAACHKAPPLPVEATFGPHPLLPPPTRALLPTVRIAKPVGWRPGETPVAPPGFTVTAFAAGLAHPRWLLVLPNGDILVAETDAPARPPRGLRGQVERLVMGMAGSHAGSPDRIVLLRAGPDAAHAASRSVLLSGLHSPFGMALVGQTLFVADTDALLAFPYRAGEAAVAGPGRKVADLPAGPIDHHWTKSLVASPDGASLFVGVGSNSNAGENGLAAEAGRAAVWRIDPASGKAEVFASGLRNPVGLAFAPGTGELFTVVNERDELGDDLVPDYLTHVVQGGFYGWPWTYWGAHPDPRLKPASRAALVPDYALGDHSAPLGLAFNPGQGLGPGWSGGAFVGLHGSWNRSRLAGYEVIFVPFVGGRPVGAPRPFLTGFLDPKGGARGRPVGVAVDGRGALLVADDVGNAIWRVARTN